MIKRAIIFMGIFFIFIFFAVPVWTQQEESPDLISLDLKGMDIRDVLKILAQKSGLNIVADKEVKGAISLYVKDVSVMDALNILVVTNSLAYEEKGTLVRVMSDKEYEKLHGQAFRENTETEIVKLNYASPSGIAQSLGSMKTKIGKIIADDASGTIVLIDNAENIKRMKGAILEMDVLLVTEVFSLDYAKAEAIKDKLEKMLSQNIGNMKFDERTNKLIVKDTPKKIKEIRNVVDAFDEKTREVVIDANIIQVTLSDAYSYGIDWSAVTKMADVTLTADTSLTTSVVGGVPNTLTVATTQNYSTVMSLLDTFGKTNVLSRPRITVANREEAKILVGAKEVYVTSEVTTTTGGTYNVADHVQFVDVGVRLGVTPEINKEGYVKMKIKPEVSATVPAKTVILTNPDGSTRTIVPYVTTSEAETTVLVKDNTTLILGGLMKDTVTEYNDKVPFLGDIPLLGKLFSTKGKSKEKTELVIFLTPHIIEGDKTFEEATKYMDEFEDGADGKKTEKAKDEDAKITKHASEKTSGKTAKPPQKKYEKPGGQSEKKIAKEKKPEITEKPKSKWTPLFSPVKKEKTGSAVKARSPETKKVSGEGERTPYEDYYFMIRGELNDMVAREDVGGLKGEVQLQFTLDKKGFLIKGPIVLNKPDLKLVRSAVNCVKKASPFLPFPKVMKKDEAEFVVTVKYE